MSEYVVELKNITKRFPGVVALKNMSIGIRPGEIHGLIGENGAGKSTMLNAVAGTFSVDSGAIVIDGVDVTRLPEHKRAAYIGRVFQDPMMGTAATMQIEENLALAARRGKRRTLRIGIRGSSVICGSLPFSKSSTIVTVFSSPASLTEYCNGVPQ